MSDLDLRLDCGALYTAVDRERRRRRIRGQREVLRQAGIKGSSMLTRLGQGHPPAVDNLVRILAWLGSLDVAPYVTTEPDESGLSARQDRPGDDSTPDAQPRPPQPRRDEMRRP